MSLNYIKKIFDLCISKKKNGRNRKNSRSALLELSNNPAISDQRVLSSEPIIERICLETNHKYAFSISDSFGDGICCKEGEGSYAVKVNDIVIVEGGDFGNSENFWFKHQNCIDDNDCDNNDYSTTYLCKKEAATCVYFPKNCDEYGEMVHIDITTFNFPELATWTIENREGMVQHEGGPYDLSKRTFTSNVCLPHGFYKIRNAGSDLIGIKLGVGNNGVAINEEYVNLKESRSFVVGSPPLLPTFAPYISTNPTSTSTDSVSCENIIVSPNIQVNAFDWSKEALHEIIKDECHNRIVFSQMFTTENGTPCTTCSFCEESKYSTIFNPMVADTCVDCGSAENTCNRIQYVTSFESEWIMTFIELLSSTKEPIHDPQRIIIEGSPSVDSNEYITLFDSELQIDFAFKDRGIKHLSPFPNSKSYKSYTITFVRSSSSKRLYLGHYGIVQSFAKQCASGIFDKLAGIKVLPYSSSATDYKQ